MRNATSESWRISLSVSWDTLPGTLTRGGCGSHLWKSWGGRASLGGGARLEVLVRRAVVAVGQRRPLARLALARGRATAGDAAVEQPRLDLLLDEVHRRRHSLLHGPGHLRLGGDREVAADVLEQGAIGLREVERVRRQPLHRLLTGFEDGAAGLELGLPVGVRVDLILHRPV